MACLGLMYALFAGRIIEALHLLDQVVVREETGGGGNYVIIGLSEAYLVAGCPENATQLAERALRLSRDRRERGYQAWAPMASGRSPGTATPQTVYWPSPLPPGPHSGRGTGMRPLRPTVTLASVPCDTTTGQWEQACTELSGGYCTIPCHGDDLLAPADGGYAGASAGMCPEVAPLHRGADTSSQGAGKVHPDTGPTALLNG